MTHEEVETLAKAILEVVDISTPDAWDAAIAAILFLRKRAPKRNASFIRAVKSASPEDEFMQTVYATLLENDAFIHGVER